MRFQGEFNEERQNNLLEQDAYKNLSEKFFKEQEIQFFCAEKLFNDDIETQESNFKARLRKKLENKKVILTLN